MCIRKQDSSSGVLYGIVGAPDVFSVAVAYWNAHKSTVRSNTFFSTMHVTILPLGMCRDSLFVPISQLVPAEAIVPHSPTKQHVHTLSSTTELALSRRLESRWLEGTFQSKLFCDSANSSSFITVNEKLTEMVFKQVKSVLLTKVNK